MKSKVKQIVLLAFFLGVWLIGVGYGFKTLNTYRETPGIGNLKNDDWPTLSNIRREFSDLTMLLFVHPYCPCSKATLHVLNEIIARVGGMVSVTVIFVKEKGTLVSEENWETTELWQSAKAIPRVKVVLDVSAEEARRFGALTSGQTLIFNKDGKLEFSGGITPARGHVGDSAGKFAILALARSQPPLQRTAPVFGCSLFKTHMKVENEL